MPGFNCKSCGEDLSYQVDIFVRSLQDERASWDEIPEDLFVKGQCHACGKGFELSGPMFTAFAIARAEEGVISDEVEELNLVDLAVTEEEYKEFLRLNEEGLEEELEEFIRQLVLKGRIKK